MSAPHRALFLLLSLLLPLQMAWAAAAAVGHCADAHEHGQSLEQVLNAADDAPSDAEPGLDAEPGSGHCHGHGAALPPVWATALLSASGLPSLCSAQSWAPPPPLNRPERPKWTCLA